MEKKSRELLAPHVEEELMDYILHTPVKIGEKLPNEFELAELFGVGRSTVRETVKSVVSKGVLEVRRGSGTYVIGTNRLEDDPLGLSGFTDKYELAADEIEKEFGINVGRQLNVIPGLGFGAEGGSSGLSHTARGIMSDEEYFRRYGRPRGAKVGNFLRGAE